MNMKDVVVIAKAFLRLISAGLYALKWYSMSMKFLVWSLHTSDYETVNVPMQNTPPKAAPPPHVSQKKMAEVVYVDADAMLKLSKLLASEIAVVKTHLDVN